MQIYLDSGSHGADDAEQLDGPERGVVDVGGDLDDALAGVREHPLRQAAEQVAVHGVGLGRHVGDDTQTRDFLDFFI